MHVEPTEFSNQNFRQLGHWVFESRSDSNRQKTNIPRLILYVDLSI